MILRLRFDRSIRETGQRFDHEWRAFRCKDRKKIGRGLVRPDFDRLLQQDRPGVEPFFKQHGCIPSESIAHRNRPLDRCGAAIFRQQRGMKVDATQLWQREHPRRNDAAISNDYDCIGFDGFELRAKLRVVLEFFRAA